MDFPAGSVYSGVITKQVFGITKAEVPQVVFTVKLDGKLMNPRRPGAGTLPAPDVQADIVVQFPADNEQRLLISLENMSRLGFDSDNLELLNNAVPGHVSFVGKKVFLAPKAQMRNEEEVIYWNFRFPADYQPRAVAVGAINQSPAAKAYKELIARKKQEAAQQVDPTGASSSTQVQEEIPF
jgi:hypothetical protein